MNSFQCITHPAFHIARLALCYANKAQISAPRLWILLRIENAYHILSLYPVLLFHDNHKSNVHMRTKSRDPGNRKKWHNALRLLLGLYI